MAAFDLSRRRFLVAGGAAIGGTLAADERIARAQALGRARTISIFHTTDLHGHVVPTQTYEGLRDVGGLARCATCIRQWRRESPHSLTVDVGDVVQGTAASIRRDGKLMIELFNRIGYDAWTLGNHDFDWGPEATDGLLDLSVAPVLTANLERGGRRPGGFDGAWGKVRPWTVKEVGGFRIGLVGLITPGLPYWLTPETLGGAAPLDPAATLRAALAELAAEKPDTIVVMGHMGWRFNDDYANPVREVLADVPGVSVYLAGHSHQNQPSWLMQGVVCSQASYFGIHCGRVDLSFDLESRKLIDRRAFTLLMDDRFALDPAVMEAARGDLDAAEADLARDVATVQAPVGGKGRASPLVRLFCEAFVEALTKRGTPVDGVFHGTFNTGDLPAGKLTVADCWRLIPYENLLVTAEVSGGELLEILTEDAGVRGSDRTLWPFDVVTDDAGKPARILRDGQEVPRDRRLTIAFNSYDGQSGGRRLMRMRDILAAPGARRQTTPVDTRGALIDHLLDKGVVG
jgi:2',3'-cyclic-nucleotide 2'-phosphodiesterase (5'-nucleotidase family)